MTYLLFILYFIVFVFLVTRISFIKKTGLTKKEIAVLFGLKILAGIALGMLMSRFYPANDYFSVNDYAKTEYRILVSDPALFFKSLFQSNYETYGSFFGSFGSYWNDLRTNLLIKLVAIFNILSRGNYYMNSLFLNFFVFFAHAAIYRVFISLFPGKKWLLITGCFLLPSTLYFTSALGKDALVFTGLALFSYALYFLLEKGWAPGKFILLITGFCMVLLIRNFVAALLLPAVVALWISYKTQLKPLTVFSGLYFAVFLMLIIWQICSPGKTALHVVAAKQKAFFEIPAGESNIATDTLQPTWQSLIKNSPQAFNHVLMRPYISEASKPMYGGIAVELLLYQLLLITSLFFYKRTGENSRPFVNFCIFFSLSALLFIGFIVPNIGAIFRYRSLYLPWLIGPLLCSIDWQKIREKSY